jgi:hypothetical protein
MSDRNTCFKCNKKINYIAAITDGELIENLKSYKNELEVTKLQLETCNESERPKIQNRINTLKVCCIETIELLEEIGHYCKYARESI